MTVGTAIAEYVEHVCIGFKYTARYSPTKVSEIQRVHESINDLDSAINLQFLDFFNLEITII